MTYVLTAIFALAGCFVGCAIIWDLTVCAFKALDRWLTRKFRLCLLNWIQGE